MYSGMLLEPNLMLQVILMYTEDWNRQIKKIDWAAVVLAGADWLVARRFVSDVCFLYPDDGCVFEGARRTDNPKMYVADENFIAEDQAYPNSHMNL